MLLIRRPMRRRYPRWHPHTRARPYIPLQRGGQVPFGGPGGGPFGPVGPIGPTAGPYTGMDPSDRSTWVRPYQPQPGMIAWLNFDGASPNAGQVIS